MIKASEDKTFPGAIVASLASPWGQAVSAGDPNNTYFGSYREVFARDLYEAWTGLMADGDLATARDATLFLFDRQQQADGSMPRNSLVNGKTAPDSFGTQLDEAAYPILMADQLRYDRLRRCTRITSSRRRTSSSPTVPSFGVERWEEQSGYSPSTIAAEIAGLVAAADLARANGDTASATLWLGVADDWQRSVKGWTVTTNGPLAAHPYFIRLSKTGDPNAAISYNVGNGGPTLDQRSRDRRRLPRAGAARRAVRRTTRTSSGRCRSSTRRSRARRRAGRAGTATTATATATARPTAIRGRRAARAPATSGPRSPPSAASKTSPPATQAGAAALLQGMANFASGVGLIPEQDWELPDLAASPYGTAPETASIGFTDGGPAGSAAPLTWSAAVVRAARRRPRRRTQSSSCRRSRINRYVAHTQGSTPLTVTSPADESSVAGSPVTVTGTTAPGNQVYVAATNTDANSATTDRLGDRRRGRLVQHPGRR